MGWVAGLCLLAVATAAVIALTHRPIRADARPLTAARVLVVAANARGVDPPHVIPIASPSPSAQPTAAPPPAHPAPVATRPGPVVRSTQQALINHDRAAYGLAPLTWSNCLYNVALANAKRIAAQGYLSHTNGPQQDLSCGLGNRAGENIGEWSSGINDSQINALFMASPEHKANILGPYHYVATAWIVAGGKGWIAVEFG